ncbi:Evolutionarily conserved signaling intermediate in Toll pathway [Blattella germanica]|nr:Evolutionarily conserved signaling intermediate in Toll pathway [Blattella germanica]
MNRKCIFYSLIQCLKFSRTLSHWHSSHPLSMSLGCVHVIKSNNNVHWTKKFIHTDKLLHSEKSVVTQDFFDKIDDKRKETFLDLIRIFESRDIHRRGHVEFIYTALKHMETFGVNKDLEAYKSLIDVLPKGKFIPTNIFQAEFFHYPKQQQCIIDLLEQMEDNGVVPDPEMESLLINIFGRKGHPVRKYWRMMYWMPKFKNLSPWPAQSPVQRELLDAHPHDVSIYVEGAFRIWLRNVSVNYFILRADARPRPNQPDEDLDDVGNLKHPIFEYQSESAIVKQPSVHEQDDGTIFAMCATGTSSRDSLLSWIRFLEADGNSALSEIPVLFTLKSPLGEVVPISEGENSDLAERKEVHSQSEKQEH